jgi:hypothetical protein
MAKRVRQDDILAQPLVPSGGAFLLLLRNRWGAMPGIQFGAASTAH